MAIDGSLRYVPFRSEVIGVACCVSGSLSLVCCGYWHLRALYMEIVQKKPPHGTYYGLLYTAQDESLQLLKVGGKQLAPALAVILTLSAIYKTIK